MTEPMEFPVNVPGVEQAIRGMREFKDSVGQAGEAGQVFVQHQSNVISNLQKTGEHAGHAHNKFRELGMEIKREAPELSHLIRDLTGQFAGIGIVVGTAAEATKMLWDEIGKGAREGQTEVKNFQEAMEKASTAISEASEKKDKKDSAYLMKNKDVLGGLTAQGGQAAVDFAANLAKQASVPVEDVNKAVLSGLQHGMTNAEITNVVKAAGVAERTGHGTFESIVSQAPGLMKTDRNRLYGSTEEVESNLLNAKGLEEFNSPKNQQARLEGLQARRKLEHDAQRAKGKYSNFDPVYQEQFQRLHGTSPAQLRAENERSINSGLGGNIAEIHENLTSQSLTEQGSSIGEPGAAFSGGGNGLPAMQRANQMEDIERQHPGITKFLQMLDEHRRDRDNLQEQHRRGVEDANKGILGGPEGSFMGGFMYKGPSQEQRIEANKRVETDQETGAKIFGVTVETLKSIDQTLKDLNHKTKPATTEAAPK